MSPWDVDLVPNQILLLIKRRFPHSITLLELITLGRSYTGVKTLFPYGIGVHIHFDGSTLYLLLRMGGSDDPRITERVHPVKNRMLHPDEQSVSAKIAHYRLCLAGFQ